MRFDPGAPHRSQNLYTEGRKPNNAGPAHNQRQQQTRNPNHEPIQGKSTDRRNFDNGKGSSNQTPYRNQQNDKSGLYCKICDTHGHA